MNNSKSTFCQTRKDSRGDQSHNSSVMEEVGDMLVCYRCWCKKQSAELVIVWRSRPDRAKHADLLLRRVSFLKDLRRELLQGTMRRKQAIQPTSL